MIKKKIRYIEQIQNSNFETSFQSITMNNLFTTFFAFTVFISFSVKSQSFDNPESITFDEATDSYYISNIGNGEILKINKTGKKTSFVSGYSSFLGIKLHDGVIYSAEDNKSGDDFIRGFNISTGELVFSLRIPDTKQLNDIEFDSKGNLYVSDREGHKIFKVSISNTSYKILDDTINTPNGLYFDNKKNRLLVCNTIDKSVVYEIDIESGKTALVVKTDYPHLDGITMDKNGLIYLTSWSIDWKNSILLKYDDKKFTEIATNSNGMADIEYNQKTNTIDIAQLFDNSVLHFNLLNKKK